MKRILNKWQIELFFNKDPHYSYPNLYVLIIGFYKFVSFPEEGDTANKSNYKGFRLMFRVLLPIVIYK